MNIFYVILLATIAAGPQEQFKEANEAFLSGGYNQAIELYNNMLAEGHDSPDVRYNLGNAYLASGRRGAAVVQYERALYLNPLFSDARINLKTAQKPVFEEPAFAPAANAPFEDFFRYLPIRIISLATLVSWCLVFALLIAKRLIPRLGYSRKTIISLVILSPVAFILCSLLACSIWVREFNPRCVVLSDSAELKEGPSSSFKTLTGLRDGLVLKIEKTENGWYRVILPSSVKGWVKSDVVDRI